LAEESNTVFEKYPLITQKKADYILFKEIVIIMQRRNH